MHDVVEQLRTYGEAVESAALGRAPSEPGQAGISPPGDAGTVPHRSGRRVSRQVVVAGVAVAALAAGSVAVWRVNGTDPDGRVVTAEPTVSTSDPEPTVSTSGPAATTSPSTSEATTSPSTSEDPADASPGDLPYFRPAPGWEALPEGAGATAANIPLGPATLAGNVPWDTVDRLEDGDVVLFAMLLPMGDRPAVDADFPPRELPLSLEDAEPTRFEGQPDHIYGERMTAQVDGWKIDLLVFYGGTAPTEPTEPSAQTVAAAQEQLALLVVPGRTGG